MYEDAGSIDRTARERQQLHEVTLLVAQIQRLLVRHSAVLQDAGVYREMRQLGNWLEVERRASTQTGAISPSGLVWLSELRDRLRLSVEEAQCLDDEAAALHSMDHISRIEDMLGTVERIDKIIGESTVIKPH